MHNINNRKIIYTKSILILYYIYTHVINNVIMNHTRNITKRRLIMKTTKSIGRLFAGSRSKWVTLAVWTVLAIVLSFALPNVNSQENNTAPNLPASSPYNQAEQIIEREFPNTDGIPALIVWVREGGLHEEDMVHLQQLTERMELEPLAYQEGVIPLHKLPLPAIQAQLSEDQSTFILPILFHEGADVEQLKESMHAFKQLVSEQFGFDPFETENDSKTELRARTSGPVGISIDATGLFEDADFLLLLGTVLLVLLILLLIYRSPILAVLPLIAVGFAYLVISPILGAMAHQGWITVDAQGIAIMTVLLFGAGTDYCLFLIARFRQLLSEEADKSKALLRAFRESSGAIAMSGFTVMIAMLSLIFAQYGAYERFAIPFSISILIMGIASLTLVPALLAIFGRTAFYPFIPRTPEMQAARALKRGKPLPSAKKKQSFDWVGQLVINKPWTIVIVTIIVLSGLALASTQIKFTYDLLSSFPEDMESREGFATIGEKFSPGQLAPVQVIVDTEGKEIDLTERLSNLPYVSNVSSPVFGQQNSDIYAIELEFNMNPYSMEAMMHIPELREVAKQSLEDAGVMNAEELVWIGGQTAEQYDTKITGDRDARVIIPIVIGMIALLLFGYLRSIVATFYLVGTVILSYFSALGLGWLILHYGLGAEAISGAIPLYSFVFIVALGEDYNIFMISSIWKKRKIMPLRQAIKEGVGETSSVITSAGLILAGTFAVLATLPIQVLVQFGIITAIGVLLDTFIVRPLLVPALTVLFGQLAFWPGKHQDIPEAKN
jgi:RND superfamily putative drug exporter